MTTHLTRKMVTGLPMTPWKRVWCCMGSANSNPYPYPCIPVTGLSGCYLYPCHSLCIYVAGRVVSVRKDLWEPIRCNECQEFGHICSACMKSKHCAHCGSDGHSTTDCLPNLPAHCISCRPDSTHPSY